MIFAVPYYNIDGEKWMESAHEIIIEYDPKNESNFNTLRSFLLKYKDHRIILNIKDLNELWKNAQNAQLFNDLIKDDIRNWAIRFSDSAHSILDAEVYLKDYKLYGKIDYFFSAAAETFEQLDRYFFTRVSDIYITNSLAFDLIRVKKRIEDIESKIKIRIYPNLCQSYWADELSIRTFFVRPEDTKYYEHCVDVMEIYAETPQQKENANIYLKIYQKDKSWCGNLKEYLINCKQDINNMNIFQDFGKKRLGCRKRCIIDGKCDFCNQQDQFLKIMDKVQDKILGVQEETTVDTIDEDIYLYIGEKSEETEA